MNSDTLSILTSRGPALAKQWLADGTITDYDDAKYYTLAQRQVGNITELSALLKKLERKPQTCLIRGRHVGADLAAIRDAAEFKPGCVRRSLEYFEDQPLRTLLVDVDKFTPTTCDALDSPEQAIEEFISTRLPPEFSGVSYHWQLSNSAGHPSKGRGLRAHLWFWSEQALTCAQLTAWAKRTAFAGDIALFRTVQVHYTAAPVMAEGVGDPYPSRSGFVEGLTGDSVTLDLDAVALAAQGAEASRGERLAAVVSEDAIATALYDRGLVRSQARDGALNIECPFSGEHSSGAGAETSTQYFPPHTGGFAHGHFKCLHGTCEGRTRGMFLEALGLPDGEATADEFEDLTVNADGTAKPLKYQFQALGALLTSKPLGWIVKGLLPKAQLGVIYGASGSGKSFVALDLAMSIARGEPWRGRRVTQMPVAYVIAEGSAGFKKRVEAYALRHDVKPDEVPIHGLAAAPNLGEPNDVKELIKGLQAVGGVGLVVIDTLAQVTPGADENTGKDMNPIMKRCQAISAATGALVLLVHHSGKDATRGARGWTGIRAALDVEIEVVRQVNGRFVRLTKSKDDIDGLEWGFDLDIVPVGFDEDGDEITSCVVREAEVPKAVALGRGLGAREKVVMAAFQVLAEAQTQGIEVEAVVEEALGSMEVEPEKRSKVKANLRATLRNLLKTADSGIGEAEDGTLYVC